jgi:pyrroline-5-carboxylate reductase
MGAALLGGLLEAGFGAENLACAERDASRRRELAGVLPGVRLLEEPIAASGVVLAVKPVDAEATCVSVAKLAPARVLSIMAGVTISRLEAWLGRGTAVVRAMPNTPALVGAGMSALSGGTHACEADLEWAEQVLGAVGVVARFTEDQIDAVTAVSGSGPAYVFLFAEAMADAGIAAGLDREAAESLAAQTIAGASELLAKSGMSPADLRAQVTSPGGTTEAALQVFADRGWRGVVIEAVIAARDRSVEMGR